MQQHASPGLERFSIAAITVIGLLSLALALHVDAADARSTSSHARQ